jgi:hypothetical protein
MYIVAAVNWLRCQLTDNGWFQSWCWHQSLVYILYSKHIQKKTTLKSPILDVGLYTSHLVIYTYRVQGRIGHIYERQCKFCGHAQATQRTNVLIHEANASQEPRKI